METCTFTRDDKSMWGETQLQSYRMARKKKNPPKCILGGQEWRWHETRKINNMYEPQKFEEQSMVIAVI